MTKKEEEISYQVGCTKLSVNKGYRIRHGNFRVLYVIDDLEKTVLIYDISHRKDAYKKR